jgi:DNA topoisomerase-1
MLVQHFPEIVDLKFTAKMEDELDDIAQGEAEWRGVLREFYSPFKEHLEQKKVEVEKHTEESEEVCEKCGKPMIVRFGRFGKFLACSGFPECKNTKNLEKKVNGTGVTCPECGEGEIVERRTRKGRIFYSCNRFPKCKFALWNKPTGEKCPKCGSLLVAAGKSKIKCSTKECDYSRAAEQE